MDNDRFEHPGRDMWESYRDEQMRQIEAGLAAMTKAGLVLDIKDFRTLRDRYYAIAVADRLHRLANHRSMAPLELNRTATGILAKHNPESAAPAPYRRTEAEQRLTNCAKVAWSKFLKKRGIRSPDHRPGRNARARIRSRAYQVGELRRGNLSARAGSMALRHALACKLEEAAQLISSAKTANSDYLTPPIDKVARELNILLREL